MTDITCNGIYAQGFDDGREYALNMIWGGRNPTAPFFNNADEELAYYQGFDAGNASVD